MTESDHLSRSLRRFGFAIAFFMGTVLIALVVVGIWTRDIIGGQNDAAVAQARTDCARTIADKTNELRDNAESLNRSANTAFRELIIYAIRNPSTPGTVSPEVARLNEQLARYTGQADEAEKALRERRKTPNGVRVKRNCPSV